MARIRLVHWKPEEAEHSIRNLQGMGYSVDCRLPAPPQLLRELRENPPDAVVIDLTRMPSSGRDIGVAIRHQRSSRRIPLVFVGGRPEKIQRTRGVLPDATYTGWESIGVALEQAIADPPSDPIVPESRMAGYAGASLPKKLGIKEEFVVALLGAPDGFKGKLGSLTRHAYVGEDEAGPRDLTIWFVRSRHRLRTNLRDVSRHAGDRPLWIAWPKRSAQTGSDLTQQFVREAGLGAGLVDYKICSIDETWSGLLFRRRGGSPRAERTGGGHAVSAESNGG